MIFWGREWTRQSGASLLPLMAGTLLLLSGCSSGGGASTAAPSFEPGYTLTNLGKMKSPRYYHTATLLDDGRVLVTGGHNSIVNHAPIPAPVASTELLDPITGTSTAGPDLNQARGRHTATKTPDGLVFLMGGPYLIECFDPQSNTVRGVGALNPPREGHSSVLLPSGKILVVGGGSSVCDLFDPATGATQQVGWLHSLDGRTSLDRSSLSAHLMPNGKVLIAGGFGSTPEWGYLGPMKVAEIFDPATNLCTLTTPLNLARCFHGSLTLPDGKIMILGGMGFDGTTRQSLASTEIFDPDTGGFAVGPSMVSPRHDFKIAPLQDGRFYISGGQSYKDNLVTGRSIAQNIDYDEIYDPVSRTFTMVLTRTGARWGQGLNPMKDGSLCITGGVIPGDVDNTILNFKLKPAMGQARTHD